MEQSETSQRDPRPEVPGPGGRPEHAGAPDLADVVATADDAILVLATDGRVRGWNAGAARLFGHDAGAMIGRPFSALCRPGRDAEVRRAIERAGRGQPARRVAIVGVRGDGGPIGVDLTFSPVRDASGAVVAVSAIGREAEPAGRPVEEALRECEALSQGLFQSVSVGMSLVDPESGRFLRVNDRFCRLTGFDAGELAGMSFPQLTHPEDRDADFAGYRRAVASGATSFSIEKRYLRKDGREIWVQVDAAILRDTGGRPRWSIAVIQDITDRKRAEAALRESEERCRVLVEETSQALWEADPRGFIRADSPSWRAYTGQAREEWLGHGWLDAVHPDDRPEVERRWREALEAGRKVTGEFRVRRPGGGWQWTSVRATPIRDPDGTILKWIGMNLDITERKEAERLIRENHDRMRTILQTAADGIVTVDARGIIESFNPAAERLFGYDAAEVLGRDLALLIPPPRRGESPAGSLCIGGRRVVGPGREAVGRRKDGSTFPLELAISAVDHLDLFVGILHDLTGRRRLEKEVLRIAAEEQRRIGQELHDSTGQVLTGLSLMARVLADRLEALAMPEHAIAARIVEESRQALDQLRDIVRGLVPVEVDADGLMAALGDLAARLDALEGVSCRFDCPSPIAVRDNTTATNLFRIAQEATTNALKHGGAGRIRISLGSRAGRIALTVRDDGCGLPASQDEAEGSGLRIMRYRAGLIGGTLEIGPADGGGTVVRCTLDEAEHDE